MEMRVARFFWSVLAVSMLAAGTATAQTATLQGPATDDQGLALPGATVTLRNIETGWTRTVVTNSEGWFRAPALPPGPYVITAELSGFSTVVLSRIPLTVGQELTVRIEMRVAALQETVTVMGAAPLVETTSNTIGTTVSRAQLDSLPVPGRSFAALAQTAPGVTGVGGGGVNAGGQLSRNNSYRIDGVSNENNSLARPRGGLSLEAVREYVVIANQFAAEYGDASGAVISVVTRSGTNDLTGRAFIFHRDESFDAQDPFSKAQGSGQAPFSQQRFGGVVGGPIKKDRMQYFGTYEGVRADKTAVITSPLVPPGEREVPNDEAGNQYFARTDNHFGSRQSMFVRYRLDEQKLFNQGVGGLNTIERRRDNINRDQDAVVSLTSVLSTRSVNEVRLQLARHFADNVVPWPLDSPTINRPSGNFGKASNMPQGRTEDRIELVDNFSYSLASHDLKLGIDFSWIRTRTYFENNTGGTFTLTTDLPFDPNDPETYPTQYTRNIGDSRLHLRNNTIGLFAQDSWRMRSNLTLNYGIRYDRENAFKESVGVSDANLNLAPRLGVAWDPFNDQKTVVRGGGGLYYSKVVLNITGNIMLAQRFVGVTIVNPGFPDPYSRGTAPQVTPSTTIAPDEVKTPVTRQMSIGVKRELLAGIAASVDYVNSRGRNAYNAPDINAPHPATGIRPNSAFSRITQYQTTGNSWYNGLLFGLERRSGRRAPQLGISYTLSKQLRDVEDFGFTAQDNYDRAAEKARANNDRRHQFVANVVWSLPAQLQLGVFAQARSGLPFDITTGVDNNRDTNINDRPDLAGPAGDPRGRATYNASFTGRVGNVPRNFGPGPAYFEAHVRLSKFVTLSKANLDRLELFVEALNVTNHVNLGTPTGNLRSAAFGRSTTLSDDSTPRQVELGFRLNFIRLRAPTSLQ